MKEVKLGVIMENASRLAGREPSLLAVPSGWKVLAAMSINEGLRRLCAEKFPMMRRVEYRRYRPDWEERVGYQRMQEVWHAGRYWRKEDEGDQGEPGVSEGWRELGMQEVAAFIAWEQPWENTVIDSGGVDVSRFAYAEDPKYHPEAAPLRVTGMTELGVMLAAPAPAGVWVVFVPEMADVSFTEWEAEAEYEIGDVVYRSSTKDVYIKQSNGGQMPPAPPEESEDWQVVRVRHEFTNYLTRLVAADLMTEDQGKFQTRSAADAEFEALCERFHGGNGERMCRRGRFR